MLTAYYSAPVGERRIAIGLSICLYECMSVCLSVCPQAYLWNRWTDLHEILCADTLWTWFGHPVAALQ